MNLIQLPNICICTLILLTRISCKLKLISQKIMSNYTNAVFFTDLTQNSCYENVKSRLGKFKRKQWLCFCRSQICLLQLSLNSSSASVFHRLWCFFSVDWRAQFIFHKWQRSAHRWFSSQSVPFLWLRHSSLTHLMSWCSERAKTGD